MRHLVFSGPGDLAWQKCPDPQLSGPRDALVRPVAVARCDLDPVIALGLYPITPPFARCRQASEERRTRADRVGSLYPVIRSEIRDFRNATTASFNAQREDFGDLRTHVDRGFTEMRGKLDATASGQQHIADLIQRLIDDEDR